MENIQKADKEFGENRMVPGERMTKKDLYEKGIVIHRYSTADNCISYDVDMKRVYHFRSPSPDGDFTLQKILR